METTRTRSSRTFYYDALVLKTIPWTVVEVGWCITFACLARPLLTAPSPGELEANLLEWMEPENGVPASYHIKLGAGRGNLNRCLIVVEGSNPLLYSPIRLELKLVKQALKKFGHPGD